MEHKCEKCGGELIEGSLAGMNGVLFYPKGEVGKMRPKRSRIVCFCCLECGHLQELRATEPEKLR